METTTSAMPSATSSALVEELPIVHILPDNPLYFLKTLKEKFQLITTRSSSGQADLFLNFAQNRLAEALKVTEKGKVHISEKLFTAFGQDIDAAQKKIEEAQQQGEQTYYLLVKLQETVAYQKSMPEQTTPSAVGRDKMQDGGGVLDWLKNLFGGKKAVLRPLVR